MQQLIDSKDNGLIKIVTGLRRVGKSYLLKTLFKEATTKRRPISETFTAQFI